MAIIERMRTEELKTFWPKEKWLVMSLSFLLSKCLQKLSAPHESCKWERADDVTII